MFVAKLCEVKTLQIHRGGWAVCMCRLSVPAACWPAGLSLAWDAGCASWVELAGLAVLAGLACQQMVTGMVGWLLAAVG